MDSKFQNIDISEFGGKDKLGDDSSDDVESDPYKLFKSISEYYDFIINLQDVDKANNIIEDYIRRNRCIGLKIIISPPNQLILSIDHIRDLLPLMQKIHKLLSLNPNLPGKWIIKYGKQPSNDAEVLSKSARWKVHIEDEHKLIIDTDATIQSNSAYVKRLIVSKQLADLLGELESFQFQFKLGHVELSNNNADISIPFNHLATYLNKKYPKWKENWQS